jgi:DNA (cytosine-5)-methyltransferase 1
MPEQQPTGILAIELFAGVGGFRLGLERNNIRVIYANEWDKYATQTYDKNFNDGIDTTDITAVPTSSIPGHDILVGGFPCQAFSIAGKRKGFNETRGTLFFDVARILKDKRPGHFILENVKGLLTHERGETFQTILTVLAGLGYRVEWMVLNSKDFGVPQNRERVYIIGHTRGKCTSQIFPLSPLNGKATEQPETDKGYAVDITLRYPKKNMKRRKQFGTVEANYYKGIANQERAGVALNLNTQSVIMGLDNGTTSKLDDGTLASQKELRAEIGDMFSVQAGKENRDTPQERGLARQPSAKPRGNMPRLPHKTSPQAAQVQTAELRSDTSQIRVLRETQPKIQEIRQSADVQAESTLSSYRIRRLTPIETERLQGFPDNWTEGVSDTQRYKQMGNAVTVNVVQAVANKLIRVCYE